MGRLTIQDGIDLIKNADLIAKKHLKEIYKILGLTKFT